MKKLYFLLSLFLILGTNSFSQYNTSGVDFWFAYMQNFDDPSNTQLYITSDIGSSGTASIPGSGWSVNFTIPADGSILIDIPDSEDAIIDIENTVFNKAVRVTSDTPVTVYAANQRTGSSDAALILPVQALGDSYFISSYDPFTSSEPSLFVIVGIEDNTVIEIIPTASISGGGGAGVPFTITLNEGEVYLVKSTSDLTGSTVKSTSTGACNNFALYAGVTCAEVPVGCSYCDHLYEQMIPTKAWGIEYITTPLMTRDSDSYRILACEDNTVVTIDGGAPINLNAGDFYEYSISTASYIVSNNPISVAQYSHGSSSDNVLSDPFMIILSPIEQVIDYIVFQAFNTSNINQFYTNIITETASTNNVQLDGATIAGWVPVPSNPTYSYIQRTLAQGSHTLTSTDGVLATVYGFGNNDSYGYLAGANIQPLNVSFDVIFDNSITSYVDFNDTLSCSQNTVGLEVSTNNVTNIEWDFGDGSPTETTDSVGHTYTNAGTYDIIMTYLPNGSCHVDSLELSITVLPLIDIDDIPDQSFCESFTLPVITGTNLTGNEAYYTGPNGTGTQLTSPITSSQTIYIYDTDGVCSGEESFTVTIGTPPNADAGLDLTLCSGLSTTIDGSASSGTPTLTYNWNNSLGAGASHTITPISTTTYILTVTDGNGCIDSDTVEVVVNNSLSVNISPASPSICYGDTITLTATSSVGGASYYWNTTDITPSIIVSPTSTTSYFVDATALSCSGSDTVTVTVNPNPNPNITGTSSFCSGDSISLNTEAYTSYEWSSSENTQFINVTIGGFHSVTVTDNNGCEGSDTVDIIEHALPTPTINGNDFCSNSSTVLETNPGYIYEWSTNATTQQITVSTAGTYYVTVTDNNNCKGTASKNVAAIPIPTPIITGQLSFCEGNTTILDAGSGYNTYTWSPVGNTQTISVTSSNTYSVTVSDFSGCTGTDQVVVTMNQNPNPVITGDLIKCEGQNTVLSVDNSYTSFYWSTSAITSSITAINPNTYSVTVTDANGCTGNTSVNFTQSPNPTPSITGDLFICNGETSILNAGSGYSNYHWSTNATSPTISVSTTGIYSITVTDVNNCSGTDFVNLTVDNVQINATESQTICNGTSIDLTASVSSGQPPYTYFWNPGSSSSVQTVSPSEQMVYTVYVVDNMSCVSNTETIIISVTDDITLETFANHDTVCPGDPVIISNNISNGMPPYTMFDEFGNITSTSVTVYPNHPHTYSYSVIDACSSTVFDDVDIYTHPEPSLNIQADVLSGCEPLFVNFTETNTTGTYTYAWSFGLSNFSNPSSSQQTSHIFDEWGTYNVGVTVTTDKGCKSSLLNENYINVFRRPEATIGASSYFVSILNPTIQFKNYSVRATNYIWNFGDGNSSLISNPNHTYNSLGNYNVELIAISNQDCKDTAYHYVKVEDVFTLYIPSAFSPDGDGINDTFCASGNGIDIKNYNLKIYDRWGEIIWETDDMYEKWDGKAKKGKNFVQNGLYKWLITLKDYKGKGYEKSGNVTVIR